MDYAGIVVGKQEHFMASSFGDVHEVPCHEGPCSEDSRCCRALVRVLRPLGLSNDFSLGRADSLRIGQQGRTLPTKLY